jgi:hypothetical protein
MRSDLVFGAMKQVSNRFLLTQALAKATRGLHKPGARIQDTTNYVLTCFGSANPISQRDGGPIAAAITTRRSKSPVAVVPQSKRPKFPANHGGPPSPPEALRCLVVRQRYRSTTAYLIAI